MCESKIPPAFAVKEAVLLQKIATALIDRVFGKQTAQAGEIAELVFWFFVSLDTRFPAARSCGGHLSLMIDIQPHGSAGSSSFAVAQPTRHLFGHLRS
jgi:hypothetical protein